VHGVLSVLGKKSRLGTVLAELVQLNRVSALVEYRVGKCRRQGNRKEIDDVPDSNTLVDQW
jgi:hypothetical protein